MEGLTLLFRKRTYEDWRFHGHYCNSQPETYTEDALDSISFTSCSSPKTYTELGEGPHTFKVYARDEAGNEDDSPAERTFTVDTTAPEVPVISSLANNSYDTDGSITVSGTAEAGNTVELLEEGSSEPVGTATAGASGDWSVTLSSITEGSHTYTARATDVAGNTSVASKPLKVVVDKTAPAITNVTPVAGATGVRRATNVTATFSEAMDPKTLVTDPTNQTSTAVQLFKTNSSVPVPAKVTVSSDGKTVTLDPYGSSTQKLAKRTKYTARIGGARDPAGNELVGNDPSGDYVWSFKTGRR